MLLSAGSWKLPKQHDIEVECYIKEPQSRACHRKHSLGRCPCGPVLYSGIIVRSRCHAKSNVLEDSKCIRIM